MGISCTKPSARTTKKEENYEPVKQLIQNFSQELVEKGPHLSTTEINDYRYRYERLLEHIEERKWNLKQKEKLKSKMTDFENSFRHYGFIDSPGTGSNMKSSSSTGNLRSNPHNTRSETSKDRRASYSESKSSKIRKDAFPKNETCAEETKKNDFRTLDNPQVHKTIDHGGRKTRSMIQASGEDVKNKSTTVFDVKTAFLRPAGRGASSDGIHRSNVTVNQTKATSASYSSSNHSSMPKEPITEERKSTPVDSSFGHSDLGTAIPVKETKEKEGHHKDTEERFKYECKISKSTMEDSRQRESRNTVKQPFDNRTTRGVVHHQYPQERVKETKENRNHHKGTKEGSTIVHHQYRQEFTRSTETPAGNSQFYVENESFNRKKNHPEKQMSVDEVAEEAQPEQLNPQETAITNICFDKENHLGLNIQDKNARPPYNSYSYLNCAENRTQRTDYQKSQNYSTEENQRFLMQQAPLVKDNERIKNRRIGGGHHIPEKKPTSSYVSPFSNNRWEHRDIYTRYTDHLRSQSYKTEDKRFQMQQASSVVKDNERIKNELKTHSSPNRHISEEKPTSSYVLDFYHKRGEHGDIYTQATDQPKLQSYKTEGKRSEMQQASSVDNDYERRNCEFEDGRQQTCQDYNSKHNRSHQYNDTIDENSTTRIHSSSGQNIDDRQGYRFDQNSSTYNDPQSKPFDNAEVIEQQPLEIIDVHQYFRDDFDINSMDESLSNLEKIKKLHQVAKTYDDKVSHFSGEKYSLEYFVLDEKLMRLIEKLDKIKCQDDHTSLEKKVKVIEYIKHLHKTLDSCAKEEE